MLIDVIEIMNDRFSHDKIEIKKGIQVMGLTKAEAESLLTKLMVVVNNMEDE